MYAICFEGKKTLPKNSPAMAGPAGPDPAPMELFESSLVCMFYHTQQLKIVISSLKFVQTWQCDLEQRFLKII